VIPDINLRSQPDTSFADFIKIDNQIRSIMSLSEKPGATLEADINKPDHVFENDYVIDKELRAGSFGVVSTTRHKKTNELFAVKVVNRAKLTKKDDEVHFREIAMMKDMIGIENIVRLVDIYITPEAFYFVQVFARGGDVFDRLVKRKSYTELDARVLSDVLIKTMRDMHKKKICHRDLKPENILLKCPKDDASIMVADFGFTKYVPEEGLKTRCGTPAFIAPEILVGKCYNTQADMWSVGCIVFMLIGGYPPFRDTTHRGLFRKIRGANFMFDISRWKNASMQSRELITNLLTVEPSQRLDANKSLLMPWFSECNTRLSSRDLSGSLSEMERFNSKRELRSAVTKIRAAAKLAQNFQVENILDLMKATDEHVEEVQEKIEEATGRSVASPPRMSQLNMSLVKKASFAKLYSVRDKIQSGTSGDVKKCYSRVHRKEYAVKIIPTNGHTDAQVLQEVSIMNHINHENVVAVVDFFEEDDFFYIVMELMAGGDVFDRILDLKTYTEKDARDLVKILLVAVNNIHQSGVAHRDIKPQNLFLESKESNSVIKVGDFGSAVRVHTPKSLNIKVGTPSYVAPEILKNEPYDQSCDMWSVGVVAYVLLSGYLPFAQKDQEKKFEAIKSGDYTFESEEWSEISDEAKNLVKGLMNTNPNTRLTASQALRSRWIHAISDKCLSRRSLDSSMRQVKDKQSRGQSIAAAFEKFKIKSKIGLNVSGHIRRVRDANKT